MQRGISVLNVPYSLLFVLKHARDVLTHIQPLKIINRFPRFYRNGFYKDRFANVAWVEIFHNDKWMVFLDEKCELFDQEMDMIELSERRINFEELSKLNEISKKSNIVSKFLKDFVKKEMFKLELFRQNKHLSKIGKQILKEKLERKNELNNNHLSLVR